MTEAPLVCPVGSGQMPSKLYAVAAEFENPAELCHAAEKVRDRGFRWWDCYSPYAIHGLDKAMGLKKSWVGLFTLGGGLTGMLVGFLLETVSSVYVYPIDTQGKPYFSCPPSCPSSTCSPSFFRHRLHPGHDHALPPAPPAPSAFRLG